MHTTTELSAVRDVTLREPCKRCGQTEGYAVVKAGQDVARCLNDHFAYNIPKAESGRSISSKRTRPDIKPSQRARILLRDGRACVICHRRDLPLEVGHILSVKDGQAQGLSNELIYSDDNLAAMCDSCNSGIGGASMPLPLVVALLHARTGGIAVAA